MTCHDLPIATVRELLISDRVELAFRILGPAALLVDGEPIVQFIRRHYESQVAR